MCVVTHFTVASGGEITWVILTRKDTIWDTVFKLADGGSENWKDENRVMNLGQHTWKFQCWKKTSFSFEILVVYFSSWSAKYQGLLNMHKLWNDGIQTEISCLHVYPKQGKIIQISHSEIPDQSPYSSRKLSCVEACKTVDLSI